jgi:hypothetical protein
MTGKNGPSVAPLAAALARLCPLFRTLLSSRAIPPLDAPLLALDRNDCRICSPHAAGGSAPALDRPSPLGRIEGLDLI